MIKDIILMFLLSFVGFVLFIISILFVDNSFLLLFIYLTYLLTINLGYFKAKGLSYESTDKEVSHC